jgi:signal peptidase I
MQGQGPSHRKGTGRRWLKAILVVVVLGVLVRCSVADLGRVAGRSMQPTLLDGDRILTNKLAFGLRIPCTHVELLAWAEPSRGDVVVFSSPLDGRRLVKRIVAVPGDRVGSDVVPPGRYFVLGDNADSVDSRRFGCVPREHILGRVVGIAFSLGRNGWCRLRWERCGRPVDQ